MSELKKRHQKSFTLQKKISILDGLQNTLLSQRQYALSKGVSEGTLRSWKRQEASLREVNIKITRRYRRIPKLRKGYFPEIDQAVVEWVINRNARGLRVKDKFIKIKAREIRNELLNNMPTESPEYTKLSKFEASNYWLSRFKQREKLVSRRHTTSRMLPHNFRSLAINYIEELHKICEKYNIKNEFIVNLDQVPRYYEQDKSYSIVRKGIREVPLKKIQRGYKRFTWTPCIRGNGKIIVKHVLFSKLTKRPNVHKNVLVDVNITGMFSIKILEDYINAVVKRTRSVFRNKGKTKKPMLILLDCYKVHEVFVKEKGTEYAKRDVYFHFIPDQLTGLLQPLDVAMNRSFQLFFNDRLSEYLEEYLSKNIKSTRTGNVTRPQPIMFSNWAHAWCETVEGDMVRNAFKVTGAVTRESFNLEDLHEPLKDLNLYWKKVI